MARDSKPKCPKCGMQLPKNGGECPQCKIAKERKGKS
jgi:predicted amidophosphoribosyltransferase